MSIEKQIQEKINATESELLKKFQTPSVTEAMKKMQDLVVRSQPKPAVFDMIDPKTLKGLKEIFKWSSIRFSKRIEIINFFLTNKNNTVPEICRNLNVSPQIAHKTLDKYFELLQTKNKENNEN